jgi:hypothetical protein
VSSKSGDSVSGEKIFCEAHGIQKPYICVQSDGHHGKCANIKHGSCKVTKTFKWIQN